MTRTLTVQAGADLVRTGDIAEVVASLPMSFRHVATDGQVVAVEGRAGWTARALDAITNGALGIVVINPTAETPTTLAGVARERQVPVVIDWPMAGNPLIPGAAAQFEGLADRHSLLESRLLVGVDADLDSVALDHLALIAGVAAPVQAITTLNRSGQGYVYRGHLSTGQPVLLSAVTSAGRPPFGWLRQLGPAAAVELTLPSPASARPAQLIATTVNGAVLSPTLYETSRRSTWRRIHELVDRHQVAPDLDRLDHDITVLGTATQPPQ